MCFELLYHLSEDVLIEMKMKQRDLIRTLIHGVERTVTIVSGWAASVGQVDGLDELTALLLLFLKKLSIFEENKTEMATYKLCAALGPLLPASASPSVSAMVQEATLRLLYNLSFDGGERSQMIRCGYVAGCGAVLRRGVRTGELRGDNKRVLSVAVRLLYSVSMDGQWRDKVSAICAELVGDLVQLVVDWPPKHVDVELIALLVNVTFPPSSGSASPHSTPLCPVTTDDMHLLLKRAQQTVDPLLFKFLHHLTVHYPELSPALSRYAADLISLSVKCASSLGPAVRPAGVDRLAAQRQRTQLRRPAIAIQLPQHAHQAAVTVGRTPGSPPQCTGRAEHADFHGWRALAASARPALSAPYSHSLTASTASTRPCNVCTASIAWYDGRQAVDWCVTATKGWRWW